MAAIAVIGGTTWAVYPRAGASALRDPSVADAPGSAVPKPGTKVLDVDAALSEARRRALAWSPEAVLVKVQAGPVRAGSVDAAGGSIRVDFAKPAGRRLGPGAQVGRERFVVTQSGSGVIAAEEQAPEEALAAADPGCGLAEAWRKAVAAGVPSSAEPSFTYSYSPKHARAVWQGQVSDDPKLHRTLDGRTCNILTR